MSFRSLLLAASCLGTGSRAGITGGVRQGVGGLVLDGGCGDTPFEPPGAFGGSPFCSDWHESRHFLTRLFSRLGNSASADFRRMSFTYFPNLVSCAIIEMITRKTRQIFTNITDKTLRLIGYNCIWYPTPREIVYCHQILR